MEREKQYASRQEAGEELLQTLRSRSVDVDRVLGIPRGALPVARPLADGLDVPLDVVVSRKIGHPDDDDFAIGAVGPDGSYRFDDEVLAQFDIERAYLDEAIERERRTVREKIDKYCGGELASITKESVLIVDDGAATGATAQMALRYAVEADAKNVTLAVPVASEMAMERFDSMADTVVCPLVPSDFTAVWEFYEEFDQVSDDEALAYLR